MPKRKKVDVVEKKNSGLSLILLCIVFLYDNKRKLKLQFIFRK
ncbi:hypothetical protein MNB_SV-14-1753 [hydrothermal vent metagenome]|uniref:Uncharacterized protein n=1 Tax=hydrothermal vent metagenome TaxID=652676 RepID=A0A1W1BSH1_9ZZZZ